jgi:hypothetical protein
MDRDSLLASADRNLAWTQRRFALGASDGAVEYDEDLLFFSMSRSWPGPYHNGAMRLNRSLDPDEFLTRARSFFSVRCPGYCVWIADHADGDLEERALATGHARIADVGAPRMVLDHPIGIGDPPDGVSLQEVADDTARTDFISVTADAYKESFLPRDVVESQLATLGALRGDGVRAVLARSRGRPVAAAMTVVSDHVGGIQLVGTIFGERGRGFAELCTRWAVNTGFELGADACVLEASEQGEPLYLRLGFVEMSRYRWCLGPPS